MGNSKEDNEHQTKLKKGDPFKIQGLTIGFVKSIGKNTYRHHQEDEE